MKTIYTIALDDDIPLSEEILNKLKMVYFLVYDTIRILEYGNEQPILCKDGIIYNELLESRSGYSFNYHFKYDDYNSGKYDPFMIDKTSFGFTINGDMLTEEKVRSIIEECKNMIGINYQFRLASYSYEVDKNNKNRLLTLKKVLSDRNDKKQSENDKGKYIRVLKPLMRVSSMILR